MVSKDGSIIAARTLEFEFDLGSKIIVVPRGTFMTALTTGWEGLSWNVKYGYVGANALGMDLVADGTTKSVWHAAHSTSPLRRIPGAA